MSDESTIYTRRFLTPFPAPGNFVTRASGPSVLRPAVGSAPGHVRTRPIAPRDRGSIRKVAISGPKDGICHRRPSGPAEGSPASCRLQACPAGEPWHQFVGSGCHAGCGVLSSGRTHLESAFGRLRGLVGSDGVSIMKLARRMRQPAQVGTRDRKVGAGPRDASAWSQWSCWPRP